MLELLKQLVSFVTELGLSLFGLLTLVLNSSLEILTTLHTTMPRLEGLLVGVLLAWLMARRNKHPILRALSAPLKLIVDILDLIWDQCVEFLRDVWGTAATWAKASVGWVVGKVKGAWNMTVGRLTGLRNKKEKEAKKK
tara:strand:- start:205 stop:621 length:417 start_codon:yes stop_codon:yes gene_type:complete